MTLLEQEQRNLVDAVELGLMLGMDRNRVTRLHRQGKLPKTVTPTRRGMRWVAGDIEKWLSLGRPSQAAFERWRDVDEEDGET